MKLLKVIGISALVSIPAAVIAAFYVPKGTIAQIIKFKLATRD